MSRAGVKCRLLTLFKYDKVLKCYEICAILYQHFFRRQLRCLRIIYNFFPEKMEWLTNKFVLWVNLNKSNMTNYDVMLYTNLQNLQVLLTHALENIYIYFLSFAFKLKSRYIFLNIAAILFTKNFTHMFNYKLPLSCSRKPLRKSLHTFSVTCKNTR